MIRSFVALPLPDRAMRGLEALQGGLPFARAVPGEDMHLTLAFLDDQPQAALRALCEELGEIRSAPMEIRLSGIFLLGGKQPGAIAVNADGGPALIAFQARIAHLIRGAGIDLERRRFMPHVTIFRLPKHREQVETARIQGWISSAALFARSPFRLTG